MKYLAVVACALAGTMVAVSVTGRPADPARGPVTREALRSAMADVLGTLPRREDPALPEPRGPLPEARPDRLEPLLRWDSDRSLQRQWLFRGDAEVSESFGAPDSIHVAAAGVEVWTYVLPQGQVRLWLNRGRLIDVHQNK